MERSPLTKRQKLTETKTFNDLRDVLKSVINLRKHTGELIEQTYSTETSDLLDGIKNIELGLPKIETYKIPDMEPTFQAFRTISKEYDETVKKIANQKLLLEILEQKKNCPIAKIIDDI